MPHGKKQKKPSSSRIIPRASSSRIIPRVEPNRNPQRATTNRNPIKAKTSKKKKATSRTMSDMPRINIRRT